MQISKFRMYKAILAGGLVIAVAIAIGTNTPIIALAAVVAAVVVADQRESRFRFFQYHVYTGGGNLAGHRPFPQPVARKRCFCWRYHGLFYLRCSTAAHVFLRLFQQEALGRYP
jgi:hypothetical protein